MFMRTRKARNIKKHVTLGQWIMKRKTLTHSRDSGFLLLIYINTQISIFFDCNALERESYFWSRVIRASNWRQVSGWNTTWLIAHGMVHMRHIIPVLMDVFLLCGIFKTKLFSWRYHLKVYTRHPRNMANIKSVLIVLFFTATIMSMIGK